MKILLINIHSIDNAGDFALMMESIRQIEENFPELTKITLVMDHQSEKIHRYPQKISVFGWVFVNNRNEKNKLSIIRTLSLPFITLPSLIIFRLFGSFPGWLTLEPIRGLIKAYCETDVVVSVAGGYLYSSGRGTTLMLKMYSLIMAMILNKPIYLLPQSIGPLKKTWEKLMVRSALSRARIVMVREPISLRVVNNCKVLGPDVRLLPDLGFGFQGASKSATRNWCKERRIFIEQSPTLGMTVINWEHQYQGFEHQKRYEKACIQAATHFIEKMGGVVYIFPQVHGPNLSQDDRVISMRIASELQAYTHKVFQINFPTPPEILKAIYGKMTLFLGTRMHSNIFAISEGVPVLAIGYLHKTQGIMDMLNLGYWVIDINEVNPDKLIVRLDELYSNRAEIKKHIEIQLAEIQKQLKLPGELIYADMVNINQLTNRDE